MLLVNVDQAIRNLELEELECEHEGRSELFVHLFAAYLCKQDLVNARYLWKRIPTNMKTGCKELEKLYEVYIALWNNQAADFFRALNFEWSANVQPIINHLEEKVRADVLHLITKAYTSIFENVFTEMASVQPDKVNEVCNSLGWVIEGTSFPRLLYPKKKICDKGSTTSSENQLYILTDFVSFLEN